MPGLSAEQIAAFEADGFLLPIRVMAESEAAGLLAKLDAVEAGRGSLTGKFRSLKNHLLITWLDALIRRAEILDPVASLIGPDILCWSTAFFAKRPGDGAHVSWHQDLNYWGLEPGDVVSAWLALTPATLDNGCMRMVPGSHKWLGEAHHDTDDANNLLSRGQTMARVIGEAETRAIVLAPGEMSLHHGNTAHASAPNGADTPRIGIAIRYMAAHVRPVNGADSAILVRGRDDYGNFEPETAPTADFDAAALAEHDRVMALRHKVMLEHA
ncbi:MAG: phytanoyl-CoA dioxygenase family protein [Rhodospirillaceae bacterium]|jgi:non-heme Fe2+,alpha-ketoglutarate-dependent halogenase